MPGTIRKLSLQVGGNPVYYRPGTPDKEVIGDTLLREEYDACRDLDAPQLIIDCGAYAGYSALFFLNAYPSAHIVAIEPDLDNFEVCRLNLQPYETRVTLIHGAVWPEAAELVVHRDRLADGREWAAMVKPPVPGETPDARGVTLQSIFEQSGFASIDLLKMNIECSETEVFARNYRGWLPHVRNMILQLHDERAEETFFTAMSDRSFLMKRIPTLYVIGAIGAARRPAQEQTPAVRARNALKNGSFEAMRVEPARFVPGGWIAGSLDVASDWHVVVCAPQFEVSLAVRTGRQRSGENALLVRMNPDHPISGNTAPYAAIENGEPIAVREGERWDIGAFVRASQSHDPLPGKVRGAYVFLRLLYDDGSTVDLAAEPQLHAAEVYVRKGAVVTIPAAPPGRLLKHATLWLYVWVVNEDRIESSAADYGSWEVVFDDVWCAQV